VAFCAWFHAVQRFNFMRAWRSRFFFAILFASPIGLKRSSFRIGMLFRQAAGKAFEFAERLSCCSTLRLDIDNDDTSYVLRSKRVDISGACGVNSGKD